MEQGMVSREQYTVGWVCALHKEMVAATAMLDEVHPTPSQPLHDSNNYRVGRIGHHNVVIACLPLGMLGNNSSATVATRLTSTFPRIRIGLMVGIGGGVPPTVQLGDVVVSAPADSHGGVIQWDFGKTEQGHTFRRVGSLDSPPTILKTALAALRVKHEMEGSQIQEFLGAMEIKWPRLVPRYTRREGLRDILFPSDYHHVETRLGQFEDDGQACSNCDRRMAIKRRPRELKVHYGLIASGNQVIKDGEFRDEINSRLGGRVLCFEMEAAGLMNDFPCIAIRGICDYADSHKNKAWQEYAAAVAAATAKEILLLVPEQDLATVPRIANHFNMTDMNDTLHDINGIGVVADYERARTNHNHTTAEEFDEQDGYNDDFDDQNDPEDQDEQDGYSDYSDNAEDPDDYCEDSDKAEDGLGVDPDFVYYSNDEPDQNSGSSSVDGESYTKYHTSKITMALTGTRFFFGGPKYQAWRLKNQLDYKFDELPYICFGTNGSWYRHYHVRNKCWSRRSQNFKNEYPDLFKKLKRNKATNACPTAVALGVRGRFFFASNKGRFWKLSKTITEIASPSRIKRLWLGKDGAFVLVKKSGSIKFDLKGDYDGLDEFLSDLKARERSIKALALSLEGDKFVIVGGGKSYAEIPDEFWPSYQAFHERNDVYF